VRGLREFRDAYLLSSETERKFVDIYDKHSPAESQYTAAHESLGIAVRVGLMPFGGAEYAVLQATPAEMVMALLLMLPVMAGAYITVRRVVFPK